MIRLTKTSIKDLKLLLTNNKNSLSIKISKISIISLMKTTKWKWTRMKDTLDIQRAIELKVGKKTLDKQAWENKTLHSEKMGVSKVELVLGSSSKT